MLKLPFLTMLLTLSLCDATYAATPLSKPFLNLGTAQAAVASVMSADTQKPTVVVSIVDDGGHLIYLERADGVAGGMPEASILKARSSANYGVTTKAIEEQINQGHSGFLNLPDALPMEGGVPVYVGKTLVGAVGVAGGASSDDGALALKIVSAIETRMH